MASVFTWVYFRAEMKNEDDRLFGIPTGKLAYGDALQNGGPRVTYKDYEKVPPAVSRGS